MTEKRAPQSRYNIGRRQIFALLAGLAAWWYGSWLVADTYFEQRTDAAFREETAKAGQFVATTAEGFERIVAVRLGMPRLLARDAEVRRALARIGPSAPGADLPYDERKRRWSADPVLAKLNERLAMDAADLGLSFIGLTDTHRNCFAASNGGTGQSVVGVSYADRDYDSPEAQARSDYRVTIGKQYGTPGMAFYSPVFDNGRKIGNVISRLDLRSFLNWLAPADAFLVDRNGVVVLASDIGLVGSAPADAPAHKIDAKARQAAYRTSDIALLDIAPAGDERYPGLRRVPGRAHPVIHRSQGIKGGVEPIIHVFWPFPQRAELAAARNLAALGAGAGGTALALAALAALVRRRGLAALTAEQERHAEALARTMVELREKTLFHETLLNAIKDAGMQLMMIENGCIVFAANRELAYRAGWSDAAIDARPLFLDIIHPDDRTRVADNHRRLLAGEAVPTRYEVALQGRGGKRVEYEIAVSLVPGSEPARVVTVCWEIGERKRAERDLHLLRRAIDQSSEEFFLMDEQWRVIDANPAACASLGLRREELLGLTPLDFNPDITREALDALMAEFGASTIEARHRAKDGRVFPVEVHGSIFADGGKRYALAMTRDIAESKCMHEMLVAREREFRSLAESSPDLIIRYDLNQRILYLNERLVRDLKLGGADEVIGWRPIDVWPDGRFQAIDAASRRAIDSGEAQEIDLHWEAEPGVHRVGHIIVVPERDAADAIVGTLAIGRDITAIRESERRLTHFVDSLPGLAYTFRLAPDGRASFPFVSAEVRELYGLEPEDVANDFTPIHDLAHPDDRPRIEAAIATSARDMTPIRIESRVCRPGLPERWIDVRSVPQSQPDGGIVWYGLMLDITEHKRMEQVLANREQEFHALAENSIDNIVRWDAGGRYLYINPTHERTLGQSSDTVVGTLLPDSHAQVKAAIARVVATGQAIHSVRQPVEVAGVVELHDVSLVPEFDAEGRMVSVLGIGRDMTDLYRMQEAIAVREREFRSLVENIPDLIVRYDMELRRIYVNPAWEAASGLSAGEVVDLPMADIPKVPQPVITAYFEGLRKVLETGTLQTAEFTWVNARGATLYLDYFMVPEYDPSGKVVSVLSVGHDVTERKRMEDALTQREREFRSLAESSPDSIIRYDRDQHIVYLNEKLVRDLGLGGADEVIGRHPIDVWPDGRYEGIDAASRRAIDSGETQEIELHWESEPGVHRVGQVIVVPERDAAGAIVGTLAIGRDITMLREAERQLTRFIDNLPGLAYTFHSSPDGKTRFPFVSAAVEEIYGISAAEAMGDMTTIHSLAHPDDRPCIEAAIAASARDLMPFRVETRVCRPDHSERWFAMRAVPDRQPDGSILWYGLMLDITERKHMEEAMARREREFRTLTENSIDNIARYDLAGRNLYCNPIYSRSMGRSADELIGKTLDEVFLDGRFASFKHHLAQMAANRHTLHFKRIPVPSPDGGMELHDVSLVPEFDAEGRLVSALGIGRNMTDIYGMQDALSLREAEFRTLAENLPVAVIRYDTDQRRRYLNPAAERMLRGMADELLGQVPGGPSVPAMPEMIEHYRDEMAATMATDAARELEFMLDALPVDQQEYYEVRFVPEHGADGRLAGVLAFWYDITERKATELAHAAALAEATRLSNLRSAFMAQMSHELRTPLNGILGFAQLMQMEDGLSGEMRDWLGIIRENGEHLLALINQVLDFAKIEDGKLTLNFKDVRLASFLDTATATIRVGAEKKHLAFALALAPDLPAFVRTDALRLRQVLLNLLGNAVKFTDRGRIELNASQPAPGRLRFAVCDTGLGIATEKLDSIFEPFEQVGEATRIAEGTGLGLAISRKLAHLMGGDIAVESRLGVGSCFYLELDMAIVADGAGTPADADPAAEAPTALLPPEAMAEVETCALPAAAELDELLEMARQGYLRRIVRRAAELEAAHAAYAAFAGHLGRLAKAYRSKEVEAYLQRCQERQAKQGKASQ